MDCSNSACATGLSPGRKTGILAPTLVLDWEPGGVAVPLIPIFPPKPILTGDATVGATGGVLGRSNTTLISTAERPKAGWLPISNLPIVLYMFSEFLFEYFY